MPTVAWTNPYAGWSRGIPTATDPTFFPIAVWLQGSWHATEMGKLGINIYVGNNAGTDSLATADLATLKAQGIYAIVGQDSVGLDNIDDPTIVGWWSSPDEPDNAQETPQMTCCDPPITPPAMVSEYETREGGRSDATDLRRTRAGRRLRRLGGAGQQRAGRVRLHARG